MTEFLLGLLGKYNLSTIMGALLTVPAVFALGVLLTVLFGLKGRRISGRVAMGLTLAAAIVFLGSLWVQLYVPEVYHQHYRAQYIGTPDPSCRVFISDDKAERVPVLDANGQPMLDADGKPVTRREKVKYTLLGRPAGPESLMRREFHFWLSSEIYPAGSHLCVLPYTDTNRQFAEQAQQVWDQVHGTEPEGDGDQQGQDGQQGQGGQSGQQGRQGQGQSGGGQKPNIVLTLPGGDDAEDEGSAQRQGEGEGEGNGEGEGEGEGGEGPDTFGLQDSQGSITLEMPEARPLPPKK